MFTFWFSNFEHFISAKSHVYLSAIHCCYCCMVACGSVLVVGVVKAAFGVVVVTIKVVVCDNTAVFLAVVAMYNIDDDVTAL